jgi:hypothetical protein
VWSTEMGLWATQRDRKRNTAAWLLKPMLDAVGDVVPHVPSRRHGMPATVRFQLGARPSPRTRVRLARAHYEENRHECTGKPVASKRITVRLTALRLGGPDNETAPLPPSKQVKQALEKETQQITASATEAVRAAGFAGVPHTDTPHVDASVLSGPSPCPACAVGFWERFIQQKRGSRGVARVGRGTAE